MRDSNKAISSAMLKNIALISMLIDHFAANVLPVIMHGDPYCDEFVYAGRLAGRLAFPLYCFMISEGAVHTRSRLRYGMRLFSLAVISAVPYSLIHSGKILSFTENNVFFALLLGLLSICVYDTLRSYGYSAFISGVLPVAICMSGIYINCDYLFIGPLTIFLFHLLRDKKERGIALTALMFLAMFPVYYFIRYNEMSPTLFAAVRYTLLVEGTAAAAFALLMFYNGERGKGLPGIAYYAAYPLHLLVYYMIIFVYNSR